MRSLRVDTQVLLDHTQPAFAGFVADYLVHLQDEYPRTPVLLFSVGVEAGLPAAALQERERQCVAALIVAVALATLCAVCSDAVGVLIDVAPIVLCCDVQAV